MDEQTNSTGRTPRVSVITTFLDAEQFLREAVESVLAQTYDDYEYVLVDDGSADGSTAIAKAYAAADPGRVRYVEHPGHVNRGLPASRNAGIRIARGELIAPLDADDRWLPHKLAEQVRLMDEHPDVGLVAGSTRYWSSWNGGTDRVVLSGHAQDRVIRPPETSLRLYPLGRDGAPSPSDLLLRKDMVERIGYFDESFVGVRRLFEDQAFLAKAYLEAPVYFANAVWFDYRQHSGSMTETSAAAGDRAIAKQYFFDWVVGYIDHRPGTDPAIRAAYQRRRRELRRSPASNKLRRIAKLVLRRGRRAPAA